MQRAFWRISNRMDKDVFFVQRNIRGAWAIYGALGVRQYYGYTKEQAIKKYREECRNTLFEAKKGARNER